MLRAAVLFLYGSTPATFNSPYRLQESVERLRAATKRSVFGLSNQAAVGRVSVKRVCLQRVIPNVGNSFKPFFIGHFEDDAPGSVLVGKFTMYWLVKVFNTFWFGGCALWTAATVALSISGPSEPWLFPLFGLGLLIVGAAFVKLCKWFARNDVAWLSDVISSALSDAPAGQRATVEQQRAPDAI